MTRRETKVQNKECAVIGHGREHRWWPRLEAGGLDCGQTVKGNCTVLKGLAFIQYSVGEQSIL